MTARDDGRPGEPALGAVTPDGCAVDLYAVLPVGPEPDLIAAAVPAGSSVLELGAGAGRVTHELVARGFDVVAVDESAEMLAHIRGADVELGSIEGLDLGRSFDVVLLCSHLVNTADDAQRDAFVATAARHVDPDGCVVIERHDPAWFDSARESSVEHGGVRYRLDDIDRPAPGLLSATVRYELVDGRAWAQSFTAARLDDHDLAGLLTRHGLVVDRLLDESGTWVRAVPITRKATV